MMNHVRILRRILCVLTICVSSKGFSEDIDSVVASVTGDGVLVLQNGRNVVQWGLEIEDVSAFEQFLTGRWVRCRELTKTNTLTLADCRLSAQVSQPSMAAEYLDLFTWLPEMELAQKVCGVFGFEDKFTTLQSNVGQVFYGCRRNLPSRGIALH